MAATSPAEPDSATLASTPEIPGVSAVQGAPGAPGAIDSAAVATAPESTVVLPVAADTSVVLEVPAGTAIDSVAAAQAGVRLTPRKQAAPAAGKVRTIEPPYRIVLRSLFFPGWGQLYNGKSLKALAVFASESALLGMIYTESRAASRAYDKHLVASNDARAAELYSEYETHFKRQESLTWWTAALVLLSLADAYVDANLITFEDEFGEPREGGVRGGGPAVSRSPRRSSGTGYPRGKVSMSIQPGPSPAGGFLCLSYGF